MMDKIHESSIDAASVFKQSDVDGSLEATVMNVGWHVPT